MNDAFSRGRKLNKYRLLKSKSPQRHTCNVENALLKYSIHQQAHKISKPGHISKLYGRPLPAAGFTLYHGQRARGLKFPAICAEKNGRVHSSRPAAALY